MAATIVKRAKHGLLRGGLGHMGDAKISVIDQQLASLTGNLHWLAARCYDISLHVQGSLMSYCASFGASAPHLAAWGVRCQTASGSNAAMSRKT